MRFSHWLLFGGSLSLLRNSLITAIICLAQANALATSTVSQNETAQEITSKFSNSFTIIQVRPMNTEQSASSILSEELSYALGESRNLTFATGFTRVWTRYTYPYTNQLEDISISLLDGNPLSLGTDSRSIDASATLGLPTSISSQKDDLYGNLGFGGGYTFKRASLSPRLGFFQNFSFYKYDTYGPNSPNYVNVSSTSYSLGLTYPIVKKTSYSFSGQVIDLLNAKQNRNSVYSLSNTISQSVNKNLSLALSYFTQNRLVENTKFYNNDTSSWRFILTLMN